MKIPYGIADFYKLVTENYYYADRTSAIPHIEAAGAQLLFLRPRRFGKSLLLSMLENYYDLARADEFDRLFGQLDIGKNPTPSRNQYFVLKLDFSVVAASGDVDQVRRALHEHINIQIESLNFRYQKHLPQPVTINPDNAIASLEGLLAIVSLTSHKLYLLIDEYDNFANEILMGPHIQNKARYEALLQGEGALKTFFKTVKSGATGRGIDRVFITGVSPIVLTDMTSGYNVAKNIYLAEEFDSLCGFTETEVRQAIGEITMGCGLPATAASEALTQMRTYYNGYRFSGAQPDQVYNPTLALYYMDHYQRRCQPPENLLDSNLSMDRGKLSYIASLPGGDKILVGALNDDEELAVRKLADRFGVEDMLTARRDATFMASLLYFFGVLTQAGRGPRGDLRLRIPNLVTRKLYAERLQAQLLPEPADQDAAERATNALLRTGDLQPLCDFMEQRYLRVLDNRDYRLANELTVKMAFLTLLFDDLLYIMDSETAAGRRYADLTMIVRAEMRQYTVPDMLLEFKFVRLPDAGLTGEQARALAREELAALPAIREKLAEARAQIPAYAAELRQRYPHELRLRAYAVVALGFERLVWEEVVMA
ncbi:MAG: AAA family ATPase [Blastocatellia bacterium]